MSDYGLLALTLLCLSLMGGLCIYLAINLVRGVRVDDHQLVRLISDTKYMLAELSSIGRTLRARPVTNTPTGENSPDGGAHEAASESAVSYTHLDVYKRQRCLFICRSEPARMLS